MALCNWCNQEMTGKVVCTETEYEILYKVYQRVPYGADETEPCHDCGTPPGGLHHPGCDDERCPRCGYQSISCGCEEDGDD